MSSVNDGQRFPTSLIRLSISEHERGAHQTAKPVTLFEYLIRTYTQPGDLVVDPVVGSGTTAVAARNTGRHWICGDQSAEYVAIANERLFAPWQPPLIADAPAPVVEAEQLALFGGDHEAES